MLRVLELLQELAELLDDDLRGERGAASIPPVLVLAEQGRC
jgi:hypothetical protein